MANPWDQYANQYTTPQAPTGQYAELVPQAAAQYGVPKPVLDWVGYREGGWNSGSTGIPTSTGKAQGNWQFMPATAQSMSVDPHDPSSSTFGAAKLLRSLYDQTGSWTEAVRRYGTFSSGQGADRDHALESGFMTHMLNSGLDPAATPPTGPVQVGSGPPVASVDPGQAQPVDANALIASLQNSSKGSPMPDPTSAASIVQQQPGNTGLFSPMNLLRIAAGFAGKKTFGQGLSGAAENAANGMMQDQQLAMLQQQRQQDAARIAIQQQQANNDAANTRGNVLDRASKLMEFMPPQTAIQVAMSSLNGPGGGSAGGQPFGGVLGQPAGPSQTPQGAPPASGGPFPLPPITGAGPGTPQPLPPGLAGSPSGSPTGGLPPGLSGPSGAPSGQGGATMSAPGQGPSSGPQWPGMPNLSALPQTGGRSMAGDLFYAPDGSAYQQRNYAYGPPKYFNTNTGAISPTLPQGSVPAQDSGVKAQQLADTNASIAAQNDALGSQKQIALLDTYKSLIPQISSGNDLWSTIQRNASSITGMQIGSTDPAAIQLAQQAQQQLANSRIMMLGHQGLGRVNVQEVQAVKNAGANWAQNPTALNSVINWQQQQEQMKQTLWDGWQNASPQEQAKGFRTFQYNFQKANKVPQMDTSAVGGQGQPAPSSGPSLTPTALAGQPVSVDSPTAAAGLPNGTAFRTPDGKVQVKGGQAPTSFSEGQTATGPGGQKIIYRNGQWGAM